MRGSSPRMTDRQRARCAGEPGMQSRAASLAARVTAAVVLAAPASAADFYAGKTIDLLIGGNVGGGYDIYARAIGRHLGRFIPGAPAIVPKNQPGAGSGRAAS